jgi:ribosomal protein S18 acetylase RimI-like enzyme
LIELLTNCVDAGASIGFLSPLSRDEASAYWLKVFGNVADGNRVILIAREHAAGPIIGSAQIAFEARANGRHRAEVQKVMVLTMHRRRGLAAALMDQVEATARSRQVTLLFLDTSDGPGGARRFYDSLGYSYVGGIPSYALDPDGSAWPNAIYYKRLAPAP